MRTVKIVALLLIVISSTAIFGQSANSEKDEKKTEKSEQTTNNIGKFSAKTFFQWSRDVQGDQEDRFELKRIYLTWERKFDKIFSAKITTDAFPLTSDTKSGYDVLIKNAYFQVAPQFGFAKITLQAGMVRTPTIGLMNKFSGIRWVNNTYISDAKLLLNGLTIDTSADLGIKLKVELFKKVSITGAYTNGEGYKTVLTSELNNGKSIHGLVNYNPYKSFFITAFIRSYGKSDTEDILYYGGSLAWKGSTVKIGASFSYITDELNSSKTNGYLIDTWLNINLKSIMGYPILLVGKYALGDYNNLTTNLIAAGPGYKINKYAQTTLYVENYRKDGTNATKVYIKAEFKI